MGDELDGGGGWGDWWGWLGDDAGDFQVGEAGVGLTGAVVGIGGM